MAAVLLVVFALAAAWRVFENDDDTAARTSTRPSTVAEAAVHPSFIYGRVTTIAGGTHEGRLRFGGDQEAFWGHFFNGVRDANRWAGLVPPERLPRTRGGIEILGFRIGNEDRPASLRRPFMVRFGDIARLDATGATGVRVTLKSGTVVDIDRMDASDFDDGVRVWRGQRGPLDYDTKLIRSIEFLAPPRPGPAPGRLHGTVRTSQGTFTGFLQWDREETLGHDTLDGRVGGRELSLRFDRARSIARASSDSLRVTLRDGREIVLSRTREAGEGNRGIYVDDPRYGRVLVAANAFERVDFSAPASNGPAYGEFPPGRPLTGSVTTRDGRRFEGRLVYDLDETETIETLDAPSEGVDYTIPFGLVASIVPDGRVTLYSGEELQLERRGDLGDGNAGMLIFVEGSERPEYVPWSEVGKIELDRPAAMYPAVAGSQ